MRCVELSFRPSADGRNLFESSKRVFVERLEVNIVEQALRQQGVRLWAAVVVPNVRTVSSLRRFSRTTDSLSLACLLAQNTRYARVGAAMLWRQHRTCVEVLLLAASAREERAKGAATALAAALFASVPSDLNKLLRAAPGAVPYWRERHGLSIVPESTTVGTSQLFSPPTEPPCTLMGLRRAKLF